MNDTHRAGEPARLDVHVTHKAYQAATGQRLEVISDIGFTLGPGEVGALVGPSGCGKTTMLRIIAGLDDDFEGAVERPRKGTIGMVFQEPRLLPWRTVEDNVRLVAPKIDEAKLAQLFDILELSAHWALYPGELSLGLARRVALARAFAIDPDLLLLDEPFVSLDDALAARLREELAILIDRRAVTTLLVTHDVAEAVELADRIFLLSARPARIMAEVPILTPRCARRKDEIAALTAEIGNRVNATRLPSSV